MKKVVGTIGAIILVAGLCIGMFGLQVGGIRLGGILKQEISNADHEAFKESKAHVESVIADLAKYQLEYNQAKTDTDKKAIGNYIATTYANFDESEIENDDLKSFFNKMRKGDF